MDTISTSQGNGTIHFSTVGQYFELVLVLVLAPRKKMKQETRTWPLLKAEAIVSCRVHEVLGICACLHLCASLWDAISRPPKARWHTRLFPPGFRQSSSLPLVRPASLSSQSKDSHSLGDRCRGTVEQRQTQDARCAAAAAEAEASTALCVVFGSATSEGFSAAQLNGSTATWGPVEASLALVDGGGPELRAALRRCTLYTRPRAEAHVYLSLQRPRMSRESGAVPGARLGAGHEPGYSTEAGVL